MCILGATDRILLIFILAMVGYLAGSFTVILMPNKSNIDIILGIIVLGLVTVGGWLVIWNYCSFIG